MDDDPAEAEHQMFHAGAGVLKGHYRSGWGYHKAIWGYYIALYKDNPTLDNHDASMFRALKRPLSNDLKVSA